jgi:hypothetical protein
MFPRVFTGPTGKPTGNNRQARGKFGLNGHSISGAVSRRRKLQRWVMGHQIGKQIRSALLTTQVLVVCYCKLFAIKNEIYYPRCCGDPPRCGCDLRLF